LNAQKLIEITRLDLLRKGQSEDPARYARRMNYVNDIKPIAVAKDLFIKTGTLTVPMNIGTGEHQYVVTIHISGIMKLIRDELDRANKVLPDRPLVYRALRKAVDTSNVYVNCQCPDYKYRFKFWASRKDYQYGEPETRPSNITNPDNRGTVCKHITAGLVRPSQWLKYVAGWISTVVRAYLEKKLDIFADDIEDLSPQMVKDEVEDIKDIDNSILEPEDSEEAKAEDEADSQAVDIDEDEIQDEENEKEE
jgi:hypothetical protein